LYFNASSKLKTTYDLNNSEYASLKNQVTTGYTMTDAVASEFTGTTFTNKFKKATLTFTSDALTHNVQMTGSPVINLDYASSGSLPQFNFQIYEVMGTVSKLVNRINYTDRAYTTNQRKTKLINGLAHSHIFKSGSKIKIVVTNLDTAPDDVNFLGTNPFVLPVMTNATHKMYLSNNCYISLPLNSATLSPIGLFAAEEPTKPNTSDNVFSLKQNFPNPFNPVTRISFAIPNNYSGLVTLKVYDVAGKEVASLVNKTVDGSNGILDVTFDGTNLSSGVYFYKLIAGNYTDIKKMILLK
jgi:hypothetical protein